MIFQTFQKFQWRSVQAYIKQEDTNTGGVLNRSRIQKVRRICDMSDSSNIILVETGFRFWQTNILIRQECLP